jgi:uncharacterized repeat protein (TIGR03806 family)
VRTAILWLVIATLSACGGGGGHEAPPVAGPAVCAHGGETVNWAALAQADCPRLADYRLFDQTTDPRHGWRAPGLGFAPANSLFSDYAHKYRALFIPPGKQARYREINGLIFPVGTVVVKTFALPISTEANSPDRLIETRLLIRREHGWVGLPYVWNLEQTEARYAPLGASRASYVIDDGVQRDFVYQVPDRATCSQCHQGRVAGEHLAPIGTTVRQLNHSMDYGDGPENQLEHWRELGILTGLPTDRVIPEVPNWKDAGQPLELRVKAYLDINCSHCHSDNGSASLSGLRLEYWRDANSYVYGVCNQSQGYYGGPLGLLYDLVPGRADQSVLPFRVGAERATATGKDLMPPLGRSLSDHEAVVLIRQWIDALPEAGCATGAGP